MKIMTINDHDDDINDDNVDNDNNDYDHGSIGADCSEIAMECFSRGTISSI